MLEVSTPQDGIVDVDTARRAVFDKPDALRGVRVVELATLVLGPAAASFLAEMGAEVIKVEIAPNGDLTRGLPFLRDGRSAYYIQQNRGKKSLCVDVKKP